MITDDDEIPRNLSGLLADEEDASNEIGWTLLTVLVIALLHVGGLLYFLS
ncbi:MAG TPA: hypothetical protein VIT23_01125 [Terrimicrobiaceae bacterium]